MAHAEPHAHDHGHGAHFIDQLCAVAVAGTLATITIVLFMQGYLTLVTPFFQWALLISAIMLLVITVIRGITLWQEVGKVGKPGHAHDHHHEHGPDCDHHHHDHHHHHHEHGPGCQHDHEPKPTTEGVSLPVVSAPPPADNEDDHGHDHDHGWAPVRYAVLLLPIMLFFLGMPNANPQNPLQNFNALYYNFDVQKKIGGMPSLVGVWFYGEAPKEVTLDLDIGEVKAGKKGDVDFNLGFKELNQAAADPNKRMLFEGRTVRLKGQFQRTSDPKAFSLVRLKQSCCATDSIPLNAIIVSPEPVTNIDSLKWVEVTGVVTFMQPKNKSEILPVVKLESRADIDDNTTPDPTHIQ